MSARIAALDKKNKIKTEISTYSVYNEHCSLCILSFQTRPELKAHVLTHFQKKICLKTRKTLLLVVDEWYELHTDDCCGVEQYSEPDFALSNFVRISNQLVKTEDDEEIKDVQNFDESVANDDVSNGQTKSENDSETEMNFDDDDNSSGCSLESSDDEFIKNFKSKGKKFKSKRPKNDNSLSSQQKKRPSRAKNEPKRTRNENSSTTKPVIPKAKRTKCRICKQNFTQETIILHLQSRHIPKIDPIPTCETCGKTFSTTGNLRSHLYLHAERGRYICSYCGKEFVRNANLKEHINLHTGARPFVCQICKKTFHRETLLRNHHRIHTGEKKYRCNIENCERAYMFDIDLKRHMFSAHGIYSKKHPCFICSKVFSENKLLKKHLESHDAH